MLSNWLGGKVCWIVVKSYFEIWNFFLVSEISTVYCIPVDRIAVKEVNWLSITNVCPLNFCSQYLFVVWLFQIQHMYRCARVQGLDTSEGLLLFGKEHFYVIDGYTMTVSREIRDIDTLPTKYAQVSIKNIDELFQMFNLGLQILKVRHSLNKRWHHSSGGCSGSLCCMGWCHAAATEHADFGEILHSSSQN